jgi:hypothetical protein
MSCGRVVWPIAIVAKVEGRTNAAIRSASRIGIPVSFRRSGRVGRSGTKLIRRQSEIEPSERDRGSEQGTVPHLQRERQRRSQSVGYTAH